CRAAEQREELAAVHSITSSASARSVGGTVRPSTFAALKLTTRANLTGALECTPDGGQIAGWELTGTCRASKDGSHAQAPHLQHRIQASGCPGIHCGRDPACAGEAPRPVP